MPFKISPMRASAALMTALWIFSVLSPSPSHASSRSNESVEFLVGDRTSERRWGHTSLRVTGGGRDVIYDFGRYGDMSLTMAEGEPILRVWENRFEQYRTYHRSDGGTTLRFIFKSTRERNQRIHAYFDHMIRNGRTYEKGNHWTSYKLKTRDFHAIRFNCVTMAIDGFHKGFPELNVHVAEYATARKLQMVYKTKARFHGGYKWRQRRWQHIWWPLDLIEVLKQEFVKKGKARQERL